MSRPTNKAIAKMRLQGNPYMVNMVSTTGPGNSPIWDREAVVNAICDRLIEEDQGVYAICDQDQHLPPASTVSRWMLEDTPLSRMLSERLSRARLEQCQRLIDQIVQIADDSSSDHYIEVKTPVALEDGQVARGRLKVNQEAIKRSELRIKTRQWLAERILPRLYAKTQQVQHTVSASDALDAVSSDPGAQFMGRFK